MEPFTVIINLEGKKFKVNVKRIYESNQIERYEISAGEKSVIVRTNYNILKKNNQRGKPDWKIEQGDVKDGAGFAKTIVAIERHFYDLLHPRVEHPKNKP